jgi:hypothetical protein
LASLAAVQTAGGSSIGSWVLIAALACLLLAAARIG